MLLDDGESSELLLLAREPVTTMEEAQMEIGFPSADVGGLATRAHEVAHESLFVLEKRRRGGLDALQGRTVDETRFPPPPNLLLESLFDRERYSG